MDNVAVTNLDFYIFLAKEIKVEIPEEKIEVQIREIEVKKIKEENWKGMGDGIILLVEVCEGNFRNVKVKRVVPTINLLYRMD